MIRSIVGKLRRGHRQPLANDYHDRPGRASTADHAIASTQRRKHSFHHGRAKLTPCLAFGRGVLRQMYQRLRAAIGCAVAAGFLAVAPASAVAEDYWQCVPFARLLSGIQIFGDAHTWWQQAAGAIRPARRPRPARSSCFQARRRACGSAMWRWSARCSPTASSRSPTPTGRSSTADAARLRRTSP